MDIEFDPIKSERTKILRGFDFDYAARVFLGRTIEAPDARCDYGEVRIRAIGAVGSDVLVVVYTDRDGVRRIISARAANRKERASWQS